MNHQDTTKKRTLPVHSTVLVPADFDFQTIVGDEIKALDGSKTAYKIYDDMIVAWMQKRFIADNGRSLPVIPSSPQNAFANYRKMLIQLGLIEDCKGNSRDYSNMPLPMISVHRSGEDWREGGVGQFPIRNIGLVTDTNERWTGFTRYPKPMWFTYQISLWALTKTHISWLKHRMEMTFWNKTASTLVQHTPLGPKKYVTIHREGAEDLTNFSRSETEDQIHRCVYTVKAEAWLWDDILAAPLVLSATVEDQNGEQVFHEVFSPNAPGPLLPDSGSPPSYVS